MTNTKSQNQDNQVEQNGQTGKVEQLEKLKTDIVAKQQELEDLKKKKDLSQEEVMRVTQLEAEILRLEQELQNLQTDVSNPDSTSHVSGTSKETSNSDNEILGKNSNNGIVGKITQKKQELTDSKDANREKQDIMKTSVELMTPSDIESLFTLHNDKTIQELETVAPGIVEKLTSMFMGVGGTNCVAKITRMILKNSLVDPFNVEKSKIDMVVLQQNLAKYDYSSVDKFYNLTQNDPIIKSILSKQDNLLIQKMFDPNSKLGQSLKKELLEPNITLFGPDTLLQIATQINQDPTTTGQTSQSGWTKFFLGAENIGIKARETAKDVGSRVGNYVVENPGKAALIVGGVTVGGWLISKLLGGKKEEEDEENVDKGNKKKQKKKKKSFWRRAWNFVKFIKRPLRIAGIGAVIYGIKKLFEWIQTGNPPLKSGPDIHDPRGKKEKEFEKLPPEKQEMYKEIANSVNNQQKEIFLQEYATGWDGKLQNSYIDENGNEVTLEKENPVLDGVTMYAIDNTYATMGNFLSEGGVIYLFPFGLASDIINYVKQAAVEKILKPFVSNLPGWIGGDTREQSIENWIKKDKANIDILRYFFRQHIKTLTYMHDLQERLLEHFILEKLTTDGYKGKVYTAEQCLAFRADPRRSELYDVVQKIKKDKATLQSWRIDEKITATFRSKKFSEAYQKAQELLAKQAPTADQVLSVRILNVLAQGVPYNGKAYTKKELDKMSQAEKQTLLQTIKNDAAWLSDHNISKNTNETMSLDLASIVADCDDLRHDITYDDETKKDVLLLAKEELQKGSISEKTREKLQIVCEELRDMVDDHDGNPGFFGALFSTFRGILNTQGINEEQFLGQSGLQEYSQRYKKILNAYATKLAKKPPETKDVQDFCSFANDVFALQKEIVIGVTTMMDVKDENSDLFQRALNSFLNTFNMARKVLFDQETKLGFWTETGYVVAAVVQGAIVITILRKGKQIVKKTISLPLRSIGKLAIRGGKELLARTFVPRLRYACPTGKALMMRDLIKGKLPLDEKIHRYIPTDWIADPKNPIPGKIVVDLNNPKLTQKNLLKFLTGADDTQAELLVEYRKNEALRKQMITATDNAMASKRGFIQRIKRKLTNNTLFFTPNTSNLSILADLHKHASSGSAMRHVLDNFAGTENDLKKLFSAIQDDEVLNKIKALPEDQAKKLGKYISRLSPEDFTKANIDATIGLLSNRNDTIDVNRILPHVQEDVTNVAKRIEVGRVKNTGIGLPLEFNDQDMATKYASFKTRYEDLIKKGITDANERRKLDEDFAKAMLVNGDIVPPSAIRGNKTLETARDLSMKHLDEIYPLLPGADNRVIQYAKRLRLIQKSIMEAACDKKSIQAIKNLVELLEAVKTASKNTNAILDSVKVLARFAELTEGELKSVKNADDFIRLLGKNAPEVENILKGISRSNVDHIFEAMIKNFRHADERKRFLKVIGKIT